VAAALLRDARNGQPYNGKRGPDGSSVHPHSRQQSITKTGHETNAERHENKRSTSVRRAPESLLIQFPSCKVVSGDFIEHRKHEPDRRTPAREEKASQRNLV
jgi:hypothetical protein